MFGWLAQADPSAGDIETRLILLIALSILGAFIMLVLLVLMTISRIRKSQKRKVTVQNRLQDLTQQDYVPPPLPPMETAEQPRVEPALPEATVAALTPIQQKLLAAEEAEETESATERDASRYTDAEMETDLAVKELLSELELEEDAGVDDLWDDINFEFEKEGELAFLMGDNLQEDAAPEPPLTVLADIGARTYLEQLNQYKLDNHGRITGTERECRLFWKSSAGKHEILVTVQDAETLNINGESFPATPEGVKQGIITALNNANF